MFKTEHKPFKIKGIKFLSILVLFASGYLGLSLSAQAFKSEKDSLENITHYSQNKADIAGAHSRLAWLKANTDLNEAIAHLDTSSILFEELQDEKSLAVVAYKKGVLSRLKGSYAMAHEQIDIFMEYARNQHDTANIANAAYQKAVIFSNQGLYESSLEYFFQTLDAYEALGDSAAIGFTLNGIGIVYKNLAKYREAEEAYLKAIAIHTRARDEGNLSDSYINLAALYMTMTRRDSALIYYEKALEIDKAFENNRGIALITYAMGKLYLDDAAYEKALEQFEKAKAIQTKNQYIIDLSNTLASSAEALLNLGKNKEAEEALDAAMDNAPESLQALMAIHQIYFMLYKNTGQFKKSLEHNILYTGYKEQIFEEENLKNINALQFRYESEKKDRQLAARELEINRNEILILRKNNQLIASLAGAVVLLVLIVASWSIFRNRQRNKSNEILALKSQKEVVRLESLISGEEKERNRLAQDLHDGINGNLSVIKYKVSSIDPAAFSKKESQAYHEAIEMLDNSVEQIRRISHNLAPPSLQNFDLLDALKQYCTNMDGTNNVRINFQHFGDRITLEEEKEIAIYRIVQELINNIIRHSEAREALIQVDNFNNSIQLTVEDDGKGFDPEQERKGIGLRNIQSRLDYLKARMDVQSTTEGTSFNINIDYSNTSIA